MLADQESPTSSTPQVQPNSTPGAHPQPLTKDHTLQRQKKRMDSWGDSASSLDDGDIRVIFQNVNGITRSPVTHKEIKANLIRLGPHLSALGETNINWRNHQVRDQWENTLQRDHTELQFSYSSCDEGRLPFLQRGGTAMFCNS